MSLRRSLALLGASAMLLNLVPGAAIAQTGTEKVLDQLQLSADKVNDPVEISALWAAKVGKADHVLVTTDAVFADSLASGAVQGALNAPLLFVNAKAGLDEQTVKTITTLGASKVTVLGGEQAISPALVGELKKVTGVMDVARVSGESRVETSIALAKLSKAKQDTVIVARADDYADSLAAGALAARTGYPVVLSTNPFKGADGRMTMVHPALETYLKEAGIKKVLVAGGQAVVADETVAAIKAIVNDTTRVAGATRRETAVALAKLWNSKGKVTVVDGYADAHGFHNGFASALSAAKLGAPVLLANKGEALSPAEEALIGPAEAGVMGYCGTYVQSSICEQVATKQGAKLVRSVLADAPAALPLKVAPGELATLVGNAKTPATREYTVDLAKDGVEYTVMLAKAKEDEKGNVVLDLGSDGLPQATPVKAELGVLNGSVSSGTSAKITALNGKITFSVEAKNGDTYGLVIPVVTVAEEGKTKLVGQGGAVKVLPQSVADAAYLSAEKQGEKAWRVEAVDRANRTLIISADDTFRSLVYKPNDVFYKDSIGDGNLIDFAVFEAKISARDVLVSDAQQQDVSDILYYASPSLPSKLVWKDVKPPYPLVKELEFETTHDSITFQIGSVIDGADLVVLARKADDDEDKDYVGNESEFTIRQTFKNVKGNGKVTVTGLNPDTKYDFATIQVVDGEESPVQNLAKTKQPGENSNLLKTAKLPVQVALSTVERVDDVVNDGVDFVHENNLPVPPPPPSSGDAGAGQGDAGAGQGPGGNAGAPADPGASGPGAPSAPGGPDALVPQPGAGAGVSPDPVAGANNADPVVGSQFLKVTLSNDKFDGGAIRPGLIKVEAKTGGEVQVGERGASAEIVKLNGTYSLDGGNALKVGKASSDQAVATGESKVFYIKLNHPLRDSKADIEYTVKFAQGALVSEDGAPSTPMEYSFNY